MGSEKDCSLEVISIQADAKRRYKKRCNIIQPRVFLNCIFFQWQHRNLRCHGKKDTTFSFSYSAGMQLLRGFLKSNLIEWTVHRCVHIEPHYHPILPGSVITFPNSKVGLLSFPFSHHSGTSQDKMQKRWKSLVLEVSLMNIFISFNN